MPAPKLELSGRFLTPMAAPRSTSLCSIRKKAGSSVRRRTELLVERIGSSLGRRSSRKKVRACGQSVQSSIRRGLSVVPLVSVVAVNGLNESQKLGLILKCVKY